MAFGIAELIILGLMFDWIARKMKLPGLLGLLFLGILIGPHVLNILNEATKSVGSDLRLIALVIILLRAGFEISKEALAKVGIRALLMSFIPCICEVIAITWIAPTILDITHLEAAILGSVLAAVSPAVVVPLMIKFMEEKRGADKSIPTLVLAGASVDDAVAIVLCTSFLGMYTGEKVNVLLKLSTIPIAVCTGIIAGALLGLGFYIFFKKTNPRATKRVLILLGCAVVMLHFEHQIKEFVPFAALLSIMTIGFIILEKCEHTAHEISSKLGKIWVFAQLLLFIMVGTQVNLSVAFNAGFTGIIIILTGLAGRSIGVQLCLVKSILSWKERAFVGISYLPKATVQAAMGAVPLGAMKAAGLPIGPGELILAIAVMSIIVTAPTGAVAITWAGKHWLKQSDQEKTAAQKAAQASG